MGKWELSTECLEFLDCMVNGTPLRRWQGIKLNLGRRMKVYLHIANYTIDDII